MLLCKESLLVIINGEADIKTCSVGQTYPREIFPGNTTDVTVDQEGCNDPFSNVDIRDYCPATFC